MASTTIWILALGLLAWLCYRCRIAGAVALFFLGHLFFGAAWIGYAMTAGRDSGVLWCIVIGAMLWLGSFLLVRYR
jgi:hypothetical protein